MKVRDFGRSESLSERLGLSELFLEARGPVPGTWCNIRSPMRRYCWHSFRRCSAMFPPPHTSGPPPSVPCSFPSCSCSFSQHFSRSCESHSETSVSRFGFAHDQGPRRSHQRVCALLCERADSCLWQVRGFLVCGQRGWGSIRRASTTLYVAIVEEGLSQKHFAEGLDRAPCRSRLNLACQSAQ